MLLSMQAATGCVQIVDAQAWHLNSDEPVSLDYNTVRHRSVHVSLFDGLELKAGSSASAPEHPLSLLAGRRPRHS